MLWNVAAPFFNHSTGTTSNWLDDFVPAGTHRFRKIPFAHAEQLNWHARLGRGTPLVGWRNYWQAGEEAVQNADGLITVFPQLALTAAIHCRMKGRRDLPIVAWCFNVGRFSGGAKRLLAQWALRDITCFVVHSSAEIKLISKYLDVEPDRVKFVPLQCAPIPKLANEENESPFVLSMGSANRDYATLIAAARMTKLPLTIVASPRSLRGLEIPENVSIRCNLAAAECRLLAQKARFSIVPLADSGAASGQVTVVEAQAMGRAVIATRSIGTSDYISNGDSGLLVHGGDCSALANAMERLWADHELRHRLEIGAAHFAQQKLSDEAAGAALGSILDAVLNSRRLAADPSLSAASPA